MINIHNRENWALYARPERRTTTTDKQYNLIQKFIRQLYLFKLDFEDKEWRHKRWMSIKVQVN